KSAHDCSEGGLAVALAECCFNPERLLGADVDLCSRRPVGDAHASHTDAATALFNESQSRIVISVGSTDAEKTTSILREHGAPFQQLGRVGGNDLCIRVNGEARSEERRGGKGGRSRGGRWWEN